MVYDALCGMSIHIHIHIHIIIYVYIYILNYMCINDEHVWVDSLSDSLLALRKATISIELFLLGETTKLQAELTIFVKMTLTL